MKHKEIKYYVYPYKTGSHSARVLAQALGGKVLRTQGSTFQESSHRKVINWGSSSCPYECLNYSHLIEDMGNKLRAFNLWKGQIDGPRIPDYTISISEAREWLKKSAVVQRNLLTSSKGQGIIVHERGSPPEQITEAPLYVRYISKDMEFRIHVFDNEVIDVQRKIRDPDKNPTDWRVRSHDNGFIFVRQGFETPPDVLEQSLRALSVSGLVFGAVDTVWNVKTDKAYVLEINCAPGLEGQTVQVYANAVKRYYGTNQSL